MSSGLSTSGNQAGKAVAFEGTLVKWMGSELLLELSLEVASFFMEKV